MVLYGLWVPQLLSGSQTLVANYLMPQNCFWHSTEAYCMEMPGPGYPPYRTVCAVESGFALAPYVDGIRLPLQSPGWLHQRGE